MTCVGPAGSLPHPWPKTSTTRSIYYQADGRDSLASAIETNTPSSHLLRLRAHLCGPQARLSLQPAPSAPACRLLIHTILGAAARLLSAAQTSIGPCITHLRPRTTNSPVARRCATCTILDASGSLSLLLSTLMTLRLHLLKRAYTLPACNFGSPLRAGPSYD